MIVSLFRDRIFLSDIESPVCSFFGDNVSLIGQLNKMQSKLSTTRTVTLGTGKRLLQGCDGDREVACRELAVAQR